MNFIDYQKHFCNAFGVFCIFCCTSITFENASKKIVITRLKLIELICKRFSYKQNFISIDYLSSNTDSTSTNLH